MDEVLAVGDARFQEKCFEVFAYYKSMNRTIVLVSHDLRSLENFCDRVLLLQNGRAVVDGAAHEVISIYRRIVASMSEPETPVAAPRQLQPSRRWGSRQVEITGVRLLGEDGQPKHTFLTGAAMTIAIDYVRHAEIEGFECGLRVRNALGHPLGKPWTKTSQYEIAPGAPGTSGTITYHIPSLTLLEGGYVLSAYLYDPHLQHAFDHLEDALEFRVADPDARMGLVELGGVWGDTASSHASAPSTSVNGADSMVPAERSAIR
jgi:lipopolysaccharide transport system ATP-binding protein